MGDPVRPTGARLSHGDGTVTPLELTYRGVEDGIHMWEAATEWVPGDRLLVDVLPAKTGITFPVDGIDQFLHESTQEETMKKIEAVPFRDDPYRWAVRALAVVLAFILLGVVGGWLTNKATGAEPERQRLAPTCTINGDSSCDQIQPKHERNARKFRNGEIHKDHGFKPANTFQNHRMVRNVMVAKIESALRKADAASTMNRTDGKSTMASATEYRTQAEAAWRNLTASASCVTTGQPTYPALPNECRSGNEPGWTKRKVQTLGAVLICGGGVMAGVFSGGTSTAVVLFGGTNCAWTFWSQMDPG